MSYHNKRQNPFGDNRGDFKRHRSVVLSEVNKSSTPRDVACNFFQLNLLSTLKLYLYDVQVIPAGDGEKKNFSTKKRAKIVNFACSRKDFRLRTYVFDHSMIIATEQIDGVHEYVSTRKGLAGKVIITYVQDLTSAIPPSEPKKALALKAQLTAGIAMMLSRTLKDLGYEADKNRYANMSNGTTIEGGKNRLLSYPGYEVKVIRATAGAFYLNINFRPVYAKDERLQEILDYSKNPNILEQVYKNSKCIMVYDKNSKKARTYKIIGKSKKIVTDTFKLRVRGATPEDPWTEREVTYVDYFKEKYGVTLDKKVTMVCAESKLGFNKVSMVDLPASLLLVTGVEKSEISKYRLEKLSSEQRLKKNQAMGTEISKQAASGKYFFNVSANATNVKALQLPTQALDIYVHNNSGDKNELRANQLFGTGNNFRASTSSSPKKFLALGLKGDEKDLENVARTFKCKEAKIRTSFNSQSELYDYLKSTKLQEFPFVIIVLDMHDKDLYKKYKRHCNDNGTVLQCVVKSTFSKNSVVFNLIVQCQAKMGIPVWSLTKYTNNNILIIGISIVKLKNKKEYNAAVFSYRTADLSTFYSQKFALQSNVTETYQTAVTNCIKEYKLKSKCLPKSILLYVEGAVGAVEENSNAEAELLGVNNAISSFASEGKIGLTYVDIMKRVSARFAFKEGSEYVNAPLGTVIDSTVTGENESAFYLVAAPANQGCANPCKYIIRAFDAQANSVANVQDITFKLCHLYFNWQGIIRLPAPVMFANKLNDFASAVLQGSEIHVDVCKKIFFV